MCFDLIIIRMNSLQKHFDAAVFAHFTSDSLKVQGGLVKNFYGAIFRLDS